MSEVLEHLKALRYSNGLTMAQILHRMAAYRHRIADVTDGVRELVRQGVLDPLDVQCSGVKWTEFRRSNYSGGKVGR